MFGLRANVQRMSRVFVRSPCMVPHHAPPVMPTQPSIVFSKRSFGSVPVLTTPTRTRFTPRFKSLSFLALGVGLGVVVAVSSVNHHLDADAEPEVGASTTEQAPVNEDNRPRRFKEMRLFSGRANQELAREIAAELGVSLGAITIKAFSDGEIGIQVHENVRGKDVYLVQPTCPPGVNDNLLELILMISTMRRASAKTITAIIPYYGYGRQDRKMQSRVPISAADVAELLQAVGVDRVVAVDLHCGQIQGFFGPRTPCDNLEAHIVALDYFSAAEQGFGEGPLKIVSPDAGGVYRAKSFRDGIRAKGIEAGLAMIIKQRLAANQVAEMDLVGSVDGCDVIMVDDMIDTAGTLTKAAAELKARGARRVFAFATHGVFSGEALKRIHNSVLEKVVVTNTIPLREKSDKIIQLSTAQLLSNAIRRIQLHQSVSELFSVPGAKRED